jgi:hypothetical protein
MDIELFLMIAEDYKAMKNLRLDEFHGIFHQEIRGIRIYRSYVISSEFKICNLVMTNTE